MLGQLQNRAGNNAPEISNEGSSKEVDVERSYMYCFTPKEGNANERSGWYALNNKYLQYSILNN